MIGVRVPEAAGEEDKIKVSERRGNRSREKIEVGRRGVRGKVGKYLCRRRRGKIVAAWRGINRGKCRGEMEKKGAFR